MPKVYFTTSLNDRYFEKASIISRRYISLSNFNKHLKGVETINETSFDLVSFLKHDITTTKIANKLGRWIDQLDPFIHERNVFLTDEDYLVSASIDDDLGFEWNTYVLYRITYLSIKERINNEISS